MTNKQSFVSADQCDRDFHTSSQTAERALNAAIVQADISQSLEEFLETFDAFYADELVLSPGNTFT
jgi:hypothetical protein